jgi:excisionase family DNA binding protein
MSGLAHALLAELDEDTLDALADRLAPRLAARLSADEQVSPYLDADEAAAHMRCSRDRIYDLVQLRKLEPRRDGRRLLFRRSDLDAYLNASARAGPGHTLLELGVESAYRVKRGRTAGTAARMAPGGTPDAVQS